MQSADGWYAALLSSFKGDVELSVSAPLDAERDFPSLGGGTRRWIHDGRTVNAMMTIFLCLLVAGFGPP